MCIFSTFGLNQDLHGFEIKEKIAWFQTLPFLFQFEETARKLFGNQNMPKKIVSHVMRLEIEKLKICFFNQFVKESTKDQIACNCMWKQGFFIKNFAKYVWTYTRYQSLIKI